MDTAKKMNSNPFIGPYAFTDKNKLHGRDRETEKLFNILIASRIVVLFSCSGAGKTSLIQAKLCPMLEKDNFQVLPIVRPGNQTLKKGNRYIQSMVQTLEDKMDQKKKIKEQKDSTLTLSKYLSKKFAAYKDSHDDKALIIDQFEEIFTRDQTDFSAKEDFFTDLGKTLSEHSNLWVLFAMREEYLAELYRYNYLIPSRFKNTFRLELLEKDAAWLAIREPILEKKVTIEDNAVNKLINDLRKIRAPYSSASDERMGHYIEPLLLQLSCHRLWEKRKNEKNISENDIVSSDYTGQTLTEYYDKKMMETSRATKKPEEEIRAWCERNLITRNNTRNMVIKGTHHTKGIENNVVEQLENCHFIRSHNQSGQIWYELIHDRFIEPVIRSNTKSKFMPKEKISSEKDLNKWLEIMAYYLSNDRRWHMVKNMTNQELIELIGSSPEECDTDFKCARILFGCHILDTVLSFTHYNEELIYSHLQEIWLSDIKQLKAFYKSTKTNANHDMVSNYYKACDEIRQQLEKTSVKASLEDFKTVKNYIMNHYLTDGKIDFHKKETTELIKRKHEKIKNKNRSVQGEDKLQARTYVEMFYENIIPAVTEQDNESILMVLKAFHFSEADEHHYHIISCFEAALAIYFLNPGKIVSFWEKSKGHEINSFFARIPVSTWPNKFMIPDECAARFLNTTSTIKFNGVMSEKQRIALKEKVSARKHKKYIDQLFEKSRLLPRGKTL